MIVEIGMEPRLIALQVLASIRGLVTDQDELPAAALMRALEANGAVSEVLSGADGAFEHWVPETAVATLTAILTQDGPQARFDAIPAGSVRVTLRIPGKTER